MKNLHEKPLQEVLSDGSSLSWECHTLVVSQPLGLWEVGEAQGISSSWISAGRNSVATLPVIQSGVKKLKQWESSVPKVCPEQHWSSSAHKPCPVTWSRRFPGIALVSWMHFNDLDLAEHPTGFAVWWKGGEKLRVGLWCLGMMR